jgi:phage gpG-like protein
MSTKWQRFTVEIPKKIGPGDREVLADEIMDYIRDRVTKKNLDKKNDPLPGYSDAYAKSLNFKIAGKSKSDVNLTLSGDMLGALTLLSHSPGKLLIGFENGSNENAKADGNIRGTYGKSKPVGPKRDFLGLTREDLDRILTKFVDTQTDQAIEDRSSEGQVD